MANQINQRPCVSRACSLEPGAGLFHATFENASGQCYPLSNTSVNPAINLVKRSDNSSHWHAKERNITFVVERNLSLQWQIVAPRTIDPRYQGQDISFVCRHSTSDVPRWIVQYFSRPTYMTWSSDSKADTRYLGSPRSMIPNQSTARMPIGGW